MRVYLQTLNDGSWTTLLDGSAQCAKPMKGLRGKSHTAQRTPKGWGGHRIEFELTLELFNMLERSPTNARLIDCETGRVVASKVTVDRDRALFRFPPTPEVRPTPRPVIRKRTNMPRIAKWKRTSHISSWYAPIVLR